MVINIDNDDEIISLIPAIKADPSHPFYDFLLQKEKYLRDVHSSTPLIELTEYLRSLILEHPEDLDPKYCN